MEVGRAKSLETSCIVVLQQMRQSQCLDFRCSLRRGVTLQCSPVPRQGDSPSTFEGATTKGAPAGTLRGSLSDLSVVKGWGCSSVGKLLQRA